MSRDRSERYGDRDDADLVAAAQAGDRAAMEALLRRHQPRIHAVCRRLAGNDADADDAAQEALLAVVRGIGRFDGRSSVGTWIYRIATNATFDELRRRGRRPTPAEPELHDTPATLTPIDDTAQRLDVDAALLQLPLDFRAAVVLRDLCGLDYAEIAEVLAIPAGTVRSRISRARAALAPLLPAERGNQPPAGDRPRTAP
jgi:RNA polymerase sigma-70 factor (ECF subfamily)